MVLAAQCLLLGGVQQLAAVTAARFSSSLSSSSASRGHPVRLRASSSESAATSSSNAPSALDIAAVAPGSSESLVARTSLIVTPEGAAGLAQVNHYEILNVPYGSSTDEIARAFKDKYNELTSQQKEGDEEAKEQLRALQVSFEILTTEAERRVYDWALKRYADRKKDSYIWPYQTDITQRYTNKEPPPVMRSFDQEGNNRVGLFFLGWVIVSIIFSVTMKTWTPYHHYAEQLRTARRR